MITHVIPSLELALCDVKIRNGKIVRATVANGNWLLLRKKGHLFVDEWLACNFSDEKGKSPVNRWDVKPEDEKFIKLKKPVYFGHYNKALGVCDEKSTIHSK